MSSNTLTLSPNARVFENVHSLNDNWIDKVQVFGHRFHLVAKGDPLKVGLQVMEGVAHLVETLVFGQLEAPILSVEGVRFEKESDLVVGLQKVGVVCLDQKKKPHSYFLKNKVIFV